MQRVVEMVHGSWERLMTKIWAHANKEYEVPMPFKGSIVPMKSTSRLCVMIASWSYKVQWREHLHQPWQEYKTWADVSWESKPTCCNLNLPCQRCGSMLDKQEHTGLWEQWPSCQDLESVCKVLAAPNRTLVIQSNLTALVTTQLVIPTLSYQP